MSCQARQYSDQMHCAKCGLTWDVNDPDAPACVEDPRSEFEEKFLELRGKGYRRERKWVLSRLSDGTYANSEVQHCWEGWKLARGIE